jgi:hypothetical protein
MTSLFLEVLLRRLAAHGRLLPILLALLGSALPAAAQAPDPPGFRLESVVVEGVQHDAVREIAAAESLLKPGREYSEQELREAVYRVKRLPFVLDAEFALRPGREQGTYELVIFVEETRLFFYTAEVGAAYDADERDFSEDDRLNWGATATVGSRWFVGQGVVSGSLQSFDNAGLVSAQAGYTRYNLFGRGGFASVSLASDLQDDRGEAYVSALSLGIPIVGNHSLRADLEWFTSEDSFGSQTSRNERRGLGLSWIYDTTDDPLFPTSGTRLTSSVRYSESEYRDRGPFYSFDQRSDDYNLGVSGRRHWALTPRQSVSAELSAFFQESEVSGEGGRYEQWSTGGRLGHSMDLWGGEKTERIGDLRWENSLQVTESEFKSSLFGSGSTTEARLTTGPVFRNAWGLLRLNFIYVDILDQDFRAP